MKNQGARIGMEQEILGPSLQAEDLLTCEFVDTVFDGPAHPRVPYFNGLDLTIQKIGFNTTERGFDFG